MITKIHNAENGRPEISTTLSYFNCYEDVERLKKSLLFCIRTVTQSKEICGDIPEMWDMCALLEDLSLTDEQCRKVDKLLFP